MRPATPTPTAIARPSRAEPADAPPAPVGPTIQASKLAPGSTSEQLWSSLIEAAPKASQKAMLERLKLITCDSGVARIACPIGMQTIVASLEPLILEGLAQLTGAPVRIEWTQAAPAPVAQSAAPTGPTGAELSQAAREHPLVKSAVEMLGGRVIKVAPRKADGL